MDVLILLLFVSLVLVTGAIILFLRGVSAGDFEHGDRLSLLPLEPDGILEEEPNRITSKESDRDTRSTETEA